MRINPLMFAEFSPLWIPSCELWLEADRQVTKVWDDPAWKISALGDGSGGGRAVTQSDPTRRLTLADDQFGNRSALVGTGPPYMVSGNIGLNAGIQHLTYTSVLSITGSLTNSGVWAWDTNSLAFQFYQGTMYVRWEGGSNPATFVFPADTSIIMTIIYDGAAGSDATKFRVYLNGVQQDITFLTGFPASTPAVSAFYLGRYTGQGFKGKIAYCGLHLISFTESQRTMFEHAYSYKYGIALAA